MFAFSPSNMASYRDCPRRFQAQSLTKEIKWKDSKQKSRGTLVHNDIQTAVQKGMQAVPIMQSGLDVMYVTQKVQETRKAMAGGAHVFIEKEMCVNSKFQPVEFFDEDAYLRCRSDILVVPEVATQPIVIIDVKSGKRWDSDDFQLRASALLTHLVYARSRILYEYWYVDSADTHAGAIDFTQGLSPVQDIIELMKRMKVDIAGNSFVPRKNKFCNWCDLKGKCGL